MTALINSILAMPGVKITIFVILGVLALLYMLSIIWVARDSYLRDAPWLLWTIIAIIPLVGVIAYCLLRPSLYQIDRDEQELEIAVKKRELMKFGECAHCGYPVEADYVVCPNCLTKLKNLCPTCGRALDPSWKVCPYCTTSIKGQSEPAAVRAALDSAIPPMQYEEEDEFYDSFDDMDEVPTGSHAV